MTQVDRGLSDWIRNQAAQSNQFVLHEGLGTNTLFLSRTLDKADRNLIPQKHLNAMPCNENWPRGLSARIEAISRGNPARQDPSQLARCRRQLLFDGNRPMESPYSAALAAKWSTPAALYDWKSSSGK